MGISQDQEYEEHEEYEDRREGVKARVNEPDEQGEVDEQQMLAVSRALMARPRLLLLDEPSLGLAPLIVQRIFEIITRINSEQGTTIFLVEQNANMALKIAHRGYVIQNGLIVKTDTGDALMADEEVKKAYLGL